MSSSPLGGTRKSRSVGTGERGDHLRGLSVKFLSGDFLKLVGADRSADLTVRDIEPKIRELSAGACPRDGNEGCAYVDVAPDPDAGLAKHMLSYTWSYKISDIVMVLKNYCTMKCLAPAEVRVWICFLCINQHRVKEKEQLGQIVPFEQFKFEFETRVNEVQHILAMMSPWQNPAYLGRVWCIFEFYTAIKNEKDLEILMPECERDAFRNSLLAGQQGELFGVLSRVRVQDAQAYSKADRENIMHHMDSSCSTKAEYDKSPTIAALNMEVRCKIQEWFVKVGAESLENQIEEGRKVDVGVINSIATMLTDSEIDYTRARWLLRASLLMQGDATCCNKAETLRMIGRLDERENRRIRAKDRFDQAQQVLDQFSDDQKQTAEWKVMSAKLLCETAWTRKGEEELTELMEAKQLLESCQDGLQSASYARVLKLIGNYKVWSKHVEEAKTYYEQAKQVYIKKEEETTPAYADLLVNISNCHSGETKLAWLMQSREVYQQAGVLKGWPIARVLKLIGDARLSLGEKPEEVVSWFEKAYEALQKTGKCTTLMCAEILHCCGQMYGQMGDRVRQLQRYESSQRIYESTERALKPKEQRGHANLLCDLADALLASGKAGLTNQLLGYYRQAEALYQKCGGPAPGRSLDDVRRKVETLTQKYEGGVQLKENMLATFRKHDTSRDGVITSEDLRKVLFTLTRPPYGDVDVDQIVHLVPFDDKDSIRFEDLVEWVFT